MAGKKSTTSSSSSHQRSSEITTPASHTQPPSKKQKTETQNNHNNIEGKPITSIDIYEPLYHIHSFRQERLNRNHNKPHDDQDQGSTQSVLLPTEVVIFIFSFLATKEVGRVAHCCSHWNSCVEIMRMEKDKKVYAVNFVELNKKQREEREEEAKRKLLDEERELQFYKERLQNWKHPKKGFTVDQLKLELKKRGVAAKGLKRKADYQAKFEQLHEEEERQTHRENALTYKKEKEEEMGRKKKEDMQMKKLLELQFPRNTFLDKLPQESVSFPRNNPQAVVRCVFQGASYDTSKLRVDNPYLKIYTTLRAAITELEHDDVLLLHPAVYDITEDAMSALIIIKNVEIIGNGPKDEIILNIPNIFAKAGVTVRSCCARLFNLTVKGIDNSHIEDGVVCATRHSFVEIDHCTIICGNSGIKYDAFSCGAVRDSLICKSATAGVYICSQAKSVVLERNIITECSLGYAEVLAEHHVQGFASAIEVSAVRNNVMTGFYPYYRPVINLHITMRGNAVFKNYGHGLGVRLDADRKRRKSHENSNGIFRVPEDYEYLDFMDDAITLTECFRTVCTHIESFEGNTFSCNEKCSELCEVHPVANHKGSTVTACRTEVCDPKLPTDYSVPKKVESLTEISKQFKVPDQCVLHNKPYHPVPLTEGEDRSMLFKCECGLSWRDSCMVGYLKKPIIIRTNRDPTQWKPFWHGSPPCSFCKLTSMDLASLRKMFSTFDFGPEAFPRLCVCEAGHIFRNLYDFSDDDDDDDDGSDEEAMMLLEDEDDDEILFEDMPFGLQLPFA